MSWADKLTVKDVTDWKTFATFAQQETGTPYPTQKQVANLRGAIKEFFGQYPQADYGTLCGIVRWAKEKRQRYATPGNLVRGGFRYAWENGYLPELDPNYETNDEELEAAIEEALTTETDPEWRRRLIVAQTSAVREQVYQEWSKRHETT